MTRWRGRGGRTVTVLAAVWLVACAPRPTSPVVRASVTDLRVNLAVVVGFSVGYGGIDIGYADGTSEQRAYLLACGQVGVMVDLSFSVQDADLTLPTTGVPRQALFERYDGRLMGFAVILGVRVDDLTNASGVGLTTSPAMSTFGATFAYAGSSCYLLPLW